MDRLWICRSGVDSLYYKKFIADKKIYIPWDGYNVDFTKITTRDEFKKIVISEKGSVSSTSISNWAGMLFSFVIEMEIGDFVLIPGFHSHEYTLGKIKGEYIYAESQELKHSRAIDIICTGIPADIFDQATRYSLGAFRTIFSLKKSHKCLEDILKWSEGC